MVKYWWWLLVIFGNYWWFWRFYTDTDTDELILTRSSVRLISAAKKMHPNNHKKVCKSYKNHTRTKHGARVTIICGSRANLQYRQHDHWECSAAINMADDLVNIWTLLSLWRNSNAKLYTKGWVKMMMKNTSQNGWLHKNSNLAGLQLASILIFWGVKVNLWGSPQKNLSHLPTTRSAIKSPFCQSLAFF